MRLADLRTALGISYDAAAWRPSRSRRLLRAFVGRRANESAGFTDEDHLSAAAEWLARAQDSQPDGGVSGRYHLKGGWTSSYPETTGYIIPTFLALAAHTRADVWQERARRAVRFLLGIQLGGGGFPGGEIAENRADPSVFNTGQIISGLVAWYRHSKDDATLAAAVRAGEWMASMQERDGSWRRGIYGTEPYTYMAYAACWLGRLGEAAHRRDFREAAERHLAWVMQQRDEHTHWFRYCGFSGVGQKADEAFTHTLAYTLAGVLDLATLTGNDVAVTAVREASAQVARTLELRRWLPGVLNQQWRGAAQFACLTGNAQMALVWMDLHRLRHDPAFVSAACKALDLVKLAQPMTESDPGLRGGIAGSDPLWGSYIRLAFPNWAAKFFIDALLAKQQTLRHLAVPPQQDALPSGVPLSLPQPNGHTAHARIVLLAGPDDRRAFRVTDACRRRGVTPTAVIREKRPQQPGLRRLAAMVRDHGLTAIIRKAWSRVTPRQQSTEQRAAEPDSPAFEQYCATNGISVFHVDRLDSPAALELITRLAPDVGVHAGAGIIRRDTIARFQQGVVNAHMGILPPVRGMNVAEWSVLYGFPVGCTVHLIDEGIDTGDIFCCRPVSTDGCRSIADLRHRVDEAQLALLGELVAVAASNGTLPARIKQSPQQGRQFFAMHAELRSLLEKHLASNGA